MSKVIQTSKTLVFKKSKDDKSVELPPGIYEKKIPEALKEELLKSGDAEEVKAHPDEIDADPKEPEKDKYKRIPSKDSNKKKDKNKNKDDDSNKDNDPNKGNGAGSGESGS